MKKITFYFSKVNFSLLEKKIFLKKVDSFFTFVRVNVQNFWYILFRYLFAILITSTELRCIDFAAVLLDLLINFGFYACFHSLRSHIQVPFSYTIPNSFFSRFVCRFLQLLTSFWWIPIQNSSYTSSLTHF